MKFNEEIERLKIVKYGLYACGIIIILGSINAIFDKNDSWSVQKKFYKRFYHSEYLFYLFVTLFMILSPYLFFEPIPNNINYQNLTDTKKIIYKLQRASIHGFIGYIISVFAYLGYTFIPFLITFIVSYYFL
tara:strand:- start:252 stop:647 length:396 start_codon:yes stop_codon:yes gene_type:complete